MPKKSILPTLAQLTKSMATKQAMLRDWGSCDAVRDLIKEMEVEIGAPAQAA